MYSIMIADDNAVEREYLSSFLHSNFSSDFKMVAEACDGSEVLEFFHSGRCDAILLDIKMPKLDGLETAAQLRQMAPGIVIVFITSHADFSYARRALKLGVSDYLLKPYVDQELRETLEDILIRLDKRRQLIPIVDVGKHPNSAYWKAKTLLNKILLDDESWHPIQPVLHRQCNPKDACKAIILFPCKYSIDEFHLVELLEGIFCKKESQALFWMRKDEIAVFLFGKKTSDFQELESSIQRSRMFFRDESGIDVFCGISAFYDGKFELKAAYDEAVSYIIRYGSAEIATRYEENGREYEKNYHAENSFLSALLSRKKKEALDAFHEYTSSSPDPYRWEYLVFIMVSTVYSVLAKENEIIEHADQLFQDFDKCITNKEKEIFFKSLIDEMIDCMGGAGAYHNLFLVRNVIKHIRNHYTERVTLQEIAESLDVSNSHLSKCFNQVTKSSFNQFLLETRMREAMRLMKQSRLPIGEIGRKVGIDDPYYFSKSFKKFAGLSPSDYVSMRRIASLDS